MFKLQRGLIVSCQAEEGSPFNSPQFIAAFARAAEMGGAIGVRIRDPENIAVVKREVKIPIIGLSKGSYGSGSVLITPDIDDVLRLVESGADLVAVDATSRLRPNGVSGYKFLQMVKSKVAVPVVADISTLDEALKASDEGADFIATTLSGYTEETADIRNLPDFDLIKKITSEISTPVIAEGGIWTPEQAKTAIDCGAYAVCVGTAITRPVSIVKKFVEMLSLGNK
ncbi:MAG: N-acetylmannosamine-6-phosphate 2-epimerase [Candidatus Kryptoniota bacterium]